MPSPIVNYWQKITFRLLVFWWWWISQHCLKTNDWILKSGRVRAGAELVFFWETSISDTFSSTRSWVLPCVSVYSETNDVDPLDLPTNLYITLPLHFTIKNIFNYSLISFSFEFYLWWMRFHVIFNWYLVLLGTWETYNFLPPWS